MNLDRAVLAFAGVVVLVSVALGHYHSPYWLLLTAFAGHQYDPSFDHRLLPGGAGVQGLWLQSGAGLSLRPEAKASP